MSPVDGSATAEAPPPPPAAAAADGAAASADPVAKPSMQPRVYQLELLELAKNRNVIAFLDTGAGKTFVSVLLIRHRMREQRRLAAAAAAAAAAEAAAEAAASAAAAPPAGLTAPATVALADGAAPAETQPVPAPPSAEAAPMDAAMSEAPDFVPVHGPSGGHSHRVAVFLAPKVALVLQQAEVLRAHLGPAVAAFVGEMGTELWEKERWHAAFRDNDVVAMTPQILLNLLSHGIIKMHQIHLLIFDECHHARSRHPYNRIMQQFYHAQEALFSPRPHIFGMTAAPADVKRNETQEDLEARIRVLEANLDARVVTVVNRASVEEVAPPPRLRVASYPTLDWEGGPVETLARRLARARSRLQCAGANFELNWLRSLQRQLGADDVAPSAQRIFFDPLVPGFTAARLDQMLGSVEHVLQTLGPYCAALCAAEVFSSLVKPSHMGHSSQDYAYAQLSKGRGGKPAAVGRLCSSVEGGVGDAEGDEETTAPARPPKPYAMRLSEEEAEQREAAIVDEVMAQRFAVAEVESEQTAAHRSVLDVLEGFAQLLGGPAFQRPAAPAEPAAPAAPAEPPGAPAANGKQVAAGEAQATAGSSAAAGTPKKGPEHSPSKTAPATAPAAAPAPRTVKEALADVRGRVACGQLLGAVPLQAMRLLLSGVQPAQLQWDVEEQLPPAEAAAAFSAATAAAAAAAAAQAVRAGGAELAAGLRSGACNSLSLEAHMQAAAAQGLSVLAMPSFPLVSPKLAALVGQLMQYRSAALAATAAAAAAAAAEETEGGAAAGSSAASPGWCGIVFVSQRMASWALHKMLSVLPCTRGVFRTSAIMGLGPPMGDGVFGFQEQSRILRRFRAGDLNLLVSTAVAEEGIDVRSCQLVVRFDLPDTAQSYIQSRGRARMHNSELLLMVQQGVQEQEEMVEHMRSYEDQLRQEVLLNIERLQAGQIDDEDVAAEAAELQAALAAAPVYEVASTGAKVTLENAQLLLHSYVSRLPSDQYTTLRPLYRTEQIGLRTFRTRVFLPNNSPVAWADGVHQGGRRSAIAAAALQACKQLHELGALNDFLLPAVLDEPKRAPRTPKQPKQRPAAGRKRLAEPDELLKNKAHEPLPPVVIEESRMLKGCLQGLLERERVTLHCYRWQAAAPGATLASDSTTAGGSSVADTAAEAANSPQLRELLGSLQHLGLLLPTPLPGKLPTFSLAVPAAGSASSDQDGSPGGQPSTTAGASSPAGAAAGPSSTGGTASSSKPPVPSSGSPPATTSRTAATSGTISVRLVPAGTVELSAEQLKPLLGCSNALLAHMFARGSYCGAASKLISSEVGEDDAAPAEGGEASPAGAAAQAATGAAAAAEAGAGARDGPGTPPAADPAARSSPSAAAAAATSPEEAVEAGQPGQQQTAGAQQLAPMQIDSGAAEAQPSGPAVAPQPAVAPSTTTACAATAAAPLSPEDAEAAAAAQQLVESALHRVLLLHDKKGLPRRKRSRAEEQAAELASCATAADEAGFLLAPLLVAGQAGSPAGSAECGCASEASGSGSGSGSDSAVVLDWAVVREIAAVAAFEGNLLGWLSQQQGQGQDVQAAQGPATKATRSSGAEERSQAGPAPGSRLSGERAAALSGRVLVTTYNGQSYLHRGTAQGLTVDSTFVRSPPSYAAHHQERAAKKARLAAEAAGAAGAAGTGEDGKGDQGAGGCSSGSTAAVPQAMAVDSVAPPADGPPSPEAAPAAQEHAAATADNPAAGPPEAEEAPAVSYAEYYAERWGQSGLCPDQPLLVAAPVSRPQLARGLDLRRSRKRPYALPSCEGEDEVHLVPQLCVLHPVPVALWRPLGTLPALMWQLEGALLADHLLGKLLPADLPAEQAPPLELVAAAVTARSALECADLERLETLGDAYLKFAVSAQLFSAHRQYHEGQLTKRKELVVANIHLAEAAVKLGLDRRLRVLPFSMRNWASPAAVRKGSKVLADAMEALLGAFVVAGGHSAALAFLQHLGLLKDWRPVSATVCIQPPGGATTAAAEGGEAVVGAEANGEGGGAVEVECDVAAIEAVLGHTFKHKWLVDEALTHCSWPGSGTRCYQRLEFLGDAVLDALVTTHFYTAHCGCTPSQMHDMRSVAVNASRLAFATVKHGLHRHVRHQSPRLFSHITDFVAEWRDRVQDALEAQQAAATPDGGATAHGIGTPGGSAEAEGGGSAAGEKAADAAALRAAHLSVLTQDAFGFRAIQAPKVLSDILESLVGAVYVDTGGQLDVVWAVTQRLLDPLVTPHTLPVHPIRKLQELVQRCGVNPKYEEAGREEGGAARVHVKVSACGVLLGESVFQATNFRAGCRLAAEAAVQAWPEHCADVMSAKSAAQDAAAAAAEVQEAGQEAHDAGQTAGGAGGAMDTAGVPAAQFEALPATSCMSL